NFTDGGTFVANGTLFQVGGGASASTYNSTVTVDMTALSTFTASSGAAGIFRLGDVAAGDNGATTTLKLAPTSSITANLIAIGADSTGTKLQTLRLGSTNNYLYANTITLGSSGSTNSRGSGTLNFNNGSGDVTIRGQAGGSDRPHGQFALRRDELSEPHEYVNRYHDGYLLLRYGYARCQRLAPRRQGLHRHGYFHGDDDARRHDGDRYGCL
ncbi:MAG: hypothetical protein EBU04_09435, partial [Verrucomicrobia bacterium]|nr:hypothetical protein [Verrucomicrobiota bacterium]